MRDHDDVNDTPSAAAPSAGMPEPFDRIMGALHGLPDVTRTSPSVIRVVPLFGVGGAELWVVQTYRQREQGDTLFLEHVGAKGSTRIVIPAQVTNAIARQRDSLTSKVRSKIGKANAEARKERGELPGFMTGKRGGKKGGKK